MEVGHQGIADLDTSWLSDTEQRAWRTVHRLRGPLLASIGRQLTRESGLSMPDYEVLVAVSESPSGVVHVQELLRSTDWEASRLSHHLTRMQSRGLVGRQPCASDGRSSEVYLTDVGRTAIERAAPGHVAAVRTQFIDLLTAEQLFTLAEIGRLVGESLDGQQNGGGSADECVAIEP